jgi:hypothetical protein
MRRVMAHIDGDTLSENSLNLNTFFVLSDIDQAGTLNPFTHIYMFDVGFPAYVHCSIAVKFNKSRYASHLVSFKAPRYIINTFGFEVKLLTQIIIYL